MRRARRIDGGNPYGSDEGRRRFGAPRRGITGVHSRSSFRRACLPFRSPEEEREWTPTKPTKWSNRRTSGPHANACRSQARNPRLIFLPAAVQLAQTTVRRKRGDMPSHSLFKSAALCAAALFVLAGCGGGGGSAGGSDGGGSGGGTGGGGGGGTGQTPAYKILATNDLGMHCVDADFSVFSILPPYNVVNAQVIRTDVDRQARARDRQRRDAELLGGRRRQRIDQQPQRRQDQFLAVRGAGLRRESRSRPGTEGPVHASGRDDDATDCVRMEGHEWPVQGRGHSDRSDRRRRPQQPLSVDATDGDRQDQQPERGNARHRVARFRGDDLPRLSRHRRPRREREQHRVVDQRRRRSPVARERPVAA